MDGAPGVDLPPADPGALIFRVPGDRRTAREEGEPGAGGEKVSKEAGWATGPNAAQKSRKMSLRLT